jgi:hypothetical protein
MTQYALKGTFSSRGLATPPATCWQPASFVYFNPSHRTSYASSAQAEELSTVRIDLERRLIMQGAILPPLATWQNFYVIIGTAAAALTGLMFVVITLLAGTRGLTGSSEGIATFNTPSVVHFCTALLVATMLSAPWQALWQPGLLLGLCGLAGMTYTAIVVRRTFHLTSYQPVLEDWIWHAIFPLASYTTFFAAAFVLTSDPVPVLFGVGAAMVLLLFIGIHNAWDNVTYITIEMPRSQNKNQD